MTDAKGVRVRQGTKELVHVNLDLQNWNMLLNLGVVARYSIHRLWNVL